MHHRCTIRAVQNGNSPRKMDSCRCPWCYVIFLGTSAAEIHRQLVEVYHNNVMNHLHVVLLHDNARPPHSLRDGSHVAAIWMGVS
jgi:hypothetical protein